MAYSNNIISVPVSIYDLQQVLSAGEDDLGTLCRRANVKKWAKYKPVQRAGVVDTTGQLKADKTWKDDATWWKADNGNCGIDYSSYTTIAALKSAIDNQYPVWRRVAPTNNYRFIDFNQYNHNVLPPITDLGASDAILRTGGTCTIMAARTPASGDNVTLADIGSFNHYYFTVAIYQGSTLKLLHSCNDSMGTLGEYGNVEIVMQYNGDDGGYQGVLQTGITYQCYGFLSSVKYTYATQGSNGVYIPLPFENEVYGVAPCDLKAVDRTQWLRVDAQVAVTGSPVVNWVAEARGGTNTNATISLVDLNGQQVQGQSHNINFANGTPLTNPSGYRLSSNINTALVMPEYAPENYRVKLVASGYDTVIAIIGYELESELEE